MTSKKMFYMLFTVVIVLGIATFGSAYLANVVLTNKTVALSKIKAQGQVVDDLQISVIRNKSDIKEYSELNKIAKAIVPQDKDQTQTVREIVKIAEENGITRLTSVTFPPSTLGTAVKVGSAGATGGITQVTPILGMSGVYVLPITVTNGQDNQVTYSRFIAFLAGLENNRRTAQVTSIIITPDVANPNMIAFSLVVNEYIKP
jgi:hypothetical protein